MKQMNLSPIDVTVMCRGSRGEIEEGVTVPEVLLLLALVIIDQPPTMIDSDRSVYYHGHVNGTNRCGGEGGSEGEAALNVY